MHFQTGPVEIFTGRIFFKDIQNCPSKGIGFVINW